MRRNRRLGGRGRQRLKQSGKRPPSSAGNIKRLEGLLNKALSDALDNSQGLRCDDEAAESTVMNANRFENGLPNDYTPPSHPSLRFLVAENDCIINKKDLKWKRVAFSYGPIWFDRLASRAEEDLNDMRHIFLEPVGDYILSHAGHNHRCGKNNERDSAFNTPTQLHIVHEWWRQFSEFGAPTDKVWHTSDVFVRDTIIVLRRLLDKSLAMASESDQPIAHNSLCKRSSFCHSESCFLLGSLEFLLNVFKSFMTACETFCASAHVGYHGECSIVETAVNELWGPLCLYLKRVAELTPSSGKSSAVISADLLGSIQYHEHRCGGKMLNSLDIRSASEATIVCMSRAPTSSCDCLKCAQAITRLGTYIGAQNPVHALLEQARRLFCIASGERESKSTCENMKCPGWLSLSNDTGAFVCAHNEFWQALLDKQKEAVVYGPAIFSRVVLMDYFLSKSTLPPETVEIVLDFAGRSIKSLDSPTLVSSLSNKTSLYTDLYCSQWNAVNGQVLRTQGSIK